ncbi:MAG: DUF2778 domain-containing protein [Bradyrhizobium sp.]
MSTSISACYDFAAHTPRNFSRKAVVPTGFLGSAAVACLVVGCAWTVYTNVFASGIYPSAGNFDVAVIRHSTAPVRTVLAASNTSVVMETPPVVAAPIVVAQGPSFSFEDRFAAAAPQSVAAAPQAVVTPPQAIAAAPQAASLPQPERQVAALAPVTPPPAAVPERKVAEAVPMPASRPAEARKSAGASVRDMAQRAKAAVMSVASNDRPEAPAKPPTIFERLFGKFESSVSNSGSALAYASADVSSTGSLGPANQNIASVGTGALYDRQTAVYDIAAHMVYLPDGTKLEAHSGLGSSLDDPRSASVRMRGVTPPHLYDLKPREALFHGVAALRLNPVGGEESIYGRSGLLAHTFMLGPNGDSNGCVSFRDYNAFLEAYRNKGVRRLAVVAHL